MDTDFSFQHDFRFAAANGYKGFRSYYAELFRSTDFDAVFVVTGGPGTGKSRFMKNLAAIAGDDCRITYYYCSSDPISLDGLILEHGKRRVAVVDATSPHERGADYPGVIDHFVSLGDCWDASKLQKQRAEILTLCEKKKQSFMRGYRYLAVAGEADNAAENLLKTVINYPKLQKAAERLADREIGKTQKETRLILSGIGMRGICRFQTVEKAADTVLTVENKYGFSRFFFDSLLNSLRTRKCEYYRIESPFSPDITSGIFFPGSRTLFIEKEEDGGTPYTFRAERFYQPRQTKEIRGDVKLLLKTANKAVSQAQASFMEAGEYHFSLESIYGDAMDFCKKEKAEAAYIERILTLLHE